MKVNNPSIKKLIKEKTVREKMMSTLDKLHLSKITMNCYKFRKMPKILKAQ